MPRNGSGTYSRVSGTPYVYNTAIDQIIVNNEMDDIATALTNSVAKNGETTMTANLPMGGYKLTGLAAGTGNGDSIRHEQVATSAALRALVSDETGTGSLVFATSPTLVTPALGTPASGVLSNCTDARVLVADAAADTTTWPMLARSQTGNQAPATDAGLTYNASTNTLTAATFSGDLSGSATSVTGSAEVTGDIGYATGAGGSVTQSTSITTAVTLNKRTGEIQCQSATFTNGTPMSFTLNNSTIGAHNNVIVNEVGAAAIGRIVAVVAAAGGSCLITIDPIPVSDVKAPLLSFSVISGVVA